MNNSISIDFGTSTCRVAYLHDRSLIIASNKFIEGKIPLLIMQSYGAKPSWSFSSIKQQIGFEETVLIGEKKCQLIELASDIFNTIKEGVGRYLGEEIYSAVITVPSCFPEKQRAAIRTAAEKGGFEVVKLLDESTAVVLASDVKGEEKTVLVYALGGGVFNASIFRVNNGSPQPLWHEGDRRLGGNDFDALIVSHIVSRLDYQVDLETLRTYYGLIQKLKFLAEKSKIELSEKDSAEIAISAKEFYTNKGYGNVKDDTKLSLTRYEFERIIAPQIETTISLTKKAIKGAGLTKEAIDMILLAGGSTRIPLVERMLREEFGTEIIVSQEETVATGAIIYGARIPEIAKKEAHRSPNHGEAKTSSAKESIDSPKTTKFLQTGDATWLNEFSPYHAQLLWNSGKQDEAINILENLLKQLPVFIANLYCSRGKVILDNNNVDEAILYLEKGLAYNKNDDLTQKLYHKACNSKGMMLADNGKLFEARSIIKKGLKYNPDCKGCTDLLGKIEDAIKKQRYSGTGHLGAFKKRKKKG